MYKYDLEKARCQKSNCYHPLDLEKTREFQKKTSIFASLTTLLTVQITTNCGKFIKRWEYQTILFVSRGICTQVKKQQLKPNIEQMNGSKVGKKSFKAVYCHAYLTSLQNTSSETLGWMNHKLESRLLGEIPTASDMQMIPL